MHTGSYTDFAIRRYLCRVNDVSGGDAVFVRCLSVCLSVCSGLVRGQSDHFGHIVLIAPKQMIQLRTLNLI